MTRIQYDTTREEDNDEKVKLEQVTRIREKEMMMMCACWDTKRIRKTRDENKMTD